MKKIYFSLLLFTTLLDTPQTFAQLTAQSAHITYHIDRMVFQRTGLP